MGSLGQVTLELESSAPSETEGLGAALGALLQPGDFVGLTGDLGAGKTCFVRGLARGMGVPEDEVSSPTFAIVQTYSGGRFPLHHADLYRLEGIDALYATGFFDLIGPDAEGAAVVEWADRVPGATPPERLQLALRELEETRRVIQATGTGARFKSLLEAWGRAAAGR